MTTEDRKKLITAIIEMVGDWESSCRLDFIEDLLSEMSCEAIAKVAEQQGVEI